MNLYPSPLKNRRHISVSPRRGWLSQHGPCRDPQAALSSRPLVLSSAFPALSPPPTSPLVLFLLFPTAPLPSVLERPCWPPRAAPELQELREQAQGAFACSYTCRMNREPEQPGSCGRGRLLWAGPAPVGGADRHSAASPLVSLPSARAS